MTKETPGIDPEKLNKPMDGKRDRVMSTSEKQQFVYELYLEKIKEEMHDAPQERYQELKKTKLVLEDAIESLERYNSGSDNTEEMEEELQEVTKSVTEILSPESESGVNEI